MRYLSFKYRLFPSRKQLRTLEFTLGECRWVYNETLSFCKKAWEERKEGISYYSSTAFLPQWKKQRESLKRVYSRLLTDAQRRVDLAFHGFFRRVKNGEKPGYPRFRGPERYDSFTFDDPKHSFRVIGQSLRLSKIGLVRINLHRPLVGSIKRVTIRRSALGKWYSIFVVEAEVAAMNPTEAIVGIDLGARVLATLSDGRSISNPRFLARDSKDLQRANRAAKKSRKGSLQRTVCWRRVRHIHERISNRRRDFCHKATSNLVKEFGTIVIEKLNYVSLLSNNPFSAKAMYDANLGSFARFLAYKAAYAGRQIVTIDPRGTSETCSVCLATNDTPLWRITFKCDSCGHRMDRDHNASLNILRLGLESVANNGQKADASLLASE